MPVSHLGLTVSHIPSATSFYLSALQPLGYHYIGSQGDSIGLGIKDADFFLCQEQTGARVSPTHIAFSAESRLSVRNCYAAALNAGGCPSGAPSYRNGDCNCFNAAVCDLDGNTIEFIFREGGATLSDIDTPAEDNRVVSWQEDVARSTVDDARSEAHTVSTRASRARSRTQTIKDLASATSKSMRPSEAPAAPGIARSHTAPTGDNAFPSKTMIGTVLGAAAGAVFAYAMCKSEEDNARDERAFNAAMSSTRSERRSSSAAPRSHRSVSTTESAAPKTHRNFSTTESVRSSRYPPRSMRAIEPARYDETEVQEVISRYTSSRRPQPTRSRTYDALEYVPASRGGRESDFTLNRSRTMPQETPQYLLEAPRSTPASRYSSRRDSDEDKALKRHDSGVSVHSHRSRRSTDTARRSSASKASTIKPPQREVSLYESAVEVPLPPSKSTSKASSRAPSYRSAHQIPLPESRAYTDVDDSDGLSDMKTVVPDDSISCVDFSKPTRNERNHKSSQHSSRRDDRSEAKSASTVKPAKSKHSAATMPVRTKSEYEKASKSGKRSYLSYA